MTATMNPVKINHQLLAYFVTHIKVKSTSIYISNIHVQNMNTYDENATKNCKGIIT